MTRLALRVCLLALVAAPSAASDRPLAFVPSARPHHDVWHVCFLEPCATATPAPSRSSLRSAALAAVAKSSASQQRRVRPAVIEYSHGYQVRRRIHKTASLATLPLFGAALWLGQSLYTNTPGDHDARRTAHLVVGTSVVSLFGVNTVTGLWNMLGEGRRDPHGRRLRFVHGLLMLLADAGFAATVMTGPNSTRASEAFTYESDKALHRNFAIASIGVGTAGYLLMLLGNR
jgi:hypothetical protein